MEKGIIVLNTDCHPINCLNEVEVKLFKPSLYGRYFQIHVINTKFTKSMLNEMTSGNTLVLKCNTLVSIQANRCFVYRSNYVKLHIYTYEKLPKLSLNK